ncbi:hypothetical protein CAOG_02429 [Capsaspora owczarzaki ATCC 30864]|uniref:Uncharacterized protein n=1 Tax=Capsaspora owczarzaki (strain ATCC 30864) TaxID=595528 RepID=A0A0D2X1R5_CAPO3|nr:hypothetical protein CAOG_02429 [Capsaspora owczarzaki ATCC 30864]KJE91269.1 hypothetical protein CAOG_002429 [Capsaspora owczarzaki ATCC 30864]|eukprot:XP_004349179.1 hypothetical protein CAOG_02429 [Capsaspora owczarzaki ATCC 30864]
MSDFADDDDVFEDAQDLVEESPADVHAAAPVEPSPAAPATPATEADDEADEAVSEVVATVHSTPAPAATATAQVEETHSATVAQEPSQPEPGPAAVSVDAQPAQHEPAPSPPPPAAAATAAAGTSTPATVAESNSQTPTESIVAPSSEPETAPAAPKALKQAEPVSPEPTPTTTQVAPTAQSTPSTVPVDAPELAVKQAAPQERASKQAEPIQTAQNTPPTVPVAAPAPAPAPAPAAASNNAGWGSWGSWGSVWSAAAATVTSVTETATNLSGNISKITREAIESVEGSLNIPTPEQMSRMAEDTSSNSASSAPPAATPSTSSPAPEPTPAKVATPVAEQSTASPSAASSSSLFGGWGLGSVLEKVKTVVPVDTTGLEALGQNVMSHGLVALETIGKRTIDAITEQGGEGASVRLRVPGAGPRPTLSQLLRDRRAESDGLAGGLASAQQQKAAALVSLSAMLDKYQGLVHLEALEMLTTNCTVKVQAAQTGLASQQLLEAHSKLDRIRMVLDLGEELTDSSAIVYSADKFLEEATALIEKLGYDRNATLVHRLADAQEAIFGELRDVLDEDVPNAVSVFQISSLTSELHQQTIDAIARITSLALEHIRKLGESLLLQRLEKERQVSTERAFANAAMARNLVALFREHLVSAQQQHSSGLATLARAASEAAGDNKDVQQQVATVQNSVQTEAQDATSYLHDALLLLVPMFQLHITDGMAATSPESPLL